MGLNTVLAGMTSTQLFKFSHTVEIATKHYVFICLDNYLFYSTPGGWRDTFSSSHAFQGKLLFQKHVSFDYDLLCTTYLHGILKIVLFEEI